MCTYVKGLVSIVTPVYNGELFVGRLLESVLNQTYGCIEMILVDDGSTDKTIEIAEKYRKQFIKQGYHYYIIRTQHHCAATAINYGLRYVSGEYLIWPDSDDELADDSIEKRVQFLLDHSQYQCVRSLMYYIDDANGKRTNSGERRGNIKNEELFFPILFSETFVCCGCYMLKSEEFFKIFPQKHIPEYEVGQNFQMLLPYMYSHLCPTIEEELYIVHIRSNSHSRKQMTQKELEQRYLDFENLIDEIASIIHIQDKNELKRIEYWKLHRRYCLFIKSKKYLQALFVKLCTIKLKYF
ncbi:MAG: glycosyltransferase [Erysipelotrichaceae bacterium]|nr:glycosyltransferase [Erysipelotrichaceae bacterium]